MASKTAYLFVNTSNTENIEYLVAKGNKIVKTGTISIQNIGELKADHLRISFLSDLSYFDTAQLKIRSKKFLNIAVKKFIDGLSVFTEPYIVRYKLLNKFDDGMSVKIAAAPKSDINELFQSLNQSAVIDSVMPVENAIVNLSEKMGIHPNKIVWAKFGTLSEIIIKNGNIISKSLSRYDPQQTNNFSEEGTLLMGDLADENKENIKWKLNVFGANLNQVLHSPEIYGLFFLDKSFNFLENVYLTKIMAYRFSKLAAVISIILSLLLTTVSAKSYLNYLKIRKTFNNKLSYLSSKNDELKAKLPNKNEITTLKRLSKLQNKLNRELNLGKFVGWLSNIMPSDALINSIDVSPAKTASKQRGAVLQTESADKEFTAKIDISIKGNYKSTKYKTIMFLKKLSLKTTPKKSIFNYTNSGKSARFRTMLTIDGTEF